MRGDTYLWISSVKKLKNSAVTLNTYYEYATRGNFRLNTAIDKQNKIDF